MINVLKIKFKMSSMLTNIIEFQDKGGSIETLGLSISIFSYGDILQDLHHIKKDKLNQLYDLLLEDDKIIKDNLEKLNEK